LELDSNQTQLSIYPERPLLGLTTYTVIVSEEAQNIYKKQLQSSYQFSFITGKSLEIDSILTPISPVNGETGFGLNSNILINAAMPMSLDSLMDATTLTDASGQAISFTYIQVNELTYMIKPSAAWTPLTQYSLQIKGTAQTAEGVPINESMDCIFTTGEKADFDPPDDVSDVLIFERLPGRFELSWVNPTTEDLVGVLLVRSTDECLNHNPENGQIYLSGSTIGNGTVVGITIATDFIETDLNPEHLYHYELFTFDSAANYNRAELPFSPDAKWVRMGCLPGEEYLQGTTDLPYPVTMQIIYDTAQGFDPLTEGIQYPTQPVLLPVSQPCSLLGLNSSIYMRVRLETERGVYIHAEHVLHRYAHSLISLNAVTSAPVGQLTSWQLEGTGYPSYEAQIDIHPDAGKETWIPGTILERPDDYLLDIDLTHSYTTEGTYQFRIRGRQPDGCASEADPWLVSNEFTISKYAYEWERVEAYKQCSLASATLNYGWFADEQKGWVVGEYGTIYYTTNGGTDWILQPLNTTKHLNVIWGTDANHVWLAGNGGLVAFFNGDYWEIQEGLTTANLNAIWGYNANQIWMVGTGGTILYYNGLYWQKQESFTTQALQDIWGTNTSHIWTVGNNGTVLTYNGIGWAEQDTTTSEHLQAIMGANSNTVWTVGNGGTVLFFDGVQWAQETSNTTNNLSSVWVTSETSVWAAGKSGDVIHFDSSSWNVETTGLTANLNDIWAWDDSHVYVVGENGASARFMGSVWEDRTIATSVALVDVFGKGVDAIWCVGSQGYVLTETVAGWESQCSGIQANLNDIWAVDPSHIWAVGDQGSIVHYDGNTWALQPSDVSIHLKALWGADENDVWAVGQWGGISKYDGSSWTAQSTGVITFFEDVWGANSKVWAVGNAGSISYFDGAVWGTQASGTTYGLNSIWGTSDTNIWVVGNGGTILHYNGSNWTQVPSDTTKTLTNVWGLDSSTIWAVGNAGTITYYNGSTWTAQVSGTGWDLYTVWGLDTTQVWAVGAWGTIQHFDGITWENQPTGLWWYGIHDIWGTDAAHVWAISGYGQIYFYGGTHWTIQDTISTFALNSLWGYSATELWAVGHQSVIIDAHY
jgi:photosystem II stability/assembly factor-like uncharacterized protein